MADLSPAALKARLSAGNAEPADVRPAVDPSKIFTIDNLWPELESAYDHGQAVGETTGFAALDPHFKWKAGELITVTGYPNHGKTACFLQLEMIKALESGWDWGVFCPENFPARELVIDMVESYVGQTSDRRWWDSRMDKSVYRLAAQRILDRMHPIYPEKHDLPTVLEYFDYIAAQVKRAGRRLRGVMIDPWNALSHDRQGLRDDQYLDEALTNLKRWALERDLCLVILAHPRNADKVGLKADETPRLPDAFDLAGGAMWNNKSDVVVAVHRPRFKEDPLDPTVMFVVHKVKKPKLVGVRGAVTLRYHVTTQRYTDDNNFSPLPAPPTAATVSTDPQSFPASKFEAAPSDHGWPLNQ